MTDVQDFLEDPRTVRHVRYPTSVPYFRSVTRICHFPSGDVLLDRADRRQCLLPAIDRVDVPASEIQRITDAVVLDTEATVYVVEDGGDRVVVPFDEELVL
ncbi:hypothetical protein ACFR9U_05760 [Halorientalis brevis]|uniref:Halobacterial output domain-containing protein n=1 Tax=Halorientalis brevis TaxID=1126241 RepID=A0ABD6CAP9_9EURY|nr:hypothetical protein [Halorientalis brevis]